MSEREALGFDADGMHIFANVDNMGLIAGTFDASQLRQLLEDRIEAELAGGLTSGLMVKALEMQLLNSLCGTAFHSGQSLFMSRDYFRFTPFINLMDNMAVDHRMMNPANIERMLLSLKDVNVTELLSDCAASISSGLSIPIESVYVDVMPAAVPRFKAGEAASEMAHREEQRMRLEDRASRSDSADEADKAMAAAGGHECVNVYLNRRNITHCAEPVYNCSQLLLCDSDSRMPVIAHPFRSNPLSELEDLSHGIDFHALKQRFPYLTHVVAGHECCTHNNFLGTSLQKIYMVVPLPRSHKLFERCMSVYMPQSSMVQVSHRVSKGSGFTTEVEHSDNTEVAQCREKYARRKKEEQILAGFLPDCSFENTRVRALLVYNASRRDGRRAYYEKLAAAEIPKAESELADLLVIRFSRVDAARRRVEDFNAKIKLLSLQNVEYRSDIKGIYVTGDLRVDPQKIEDAVKRDCSIVLLTNDFSRNWTPEELFLTYQRSLSNLHSPELTEQKALPVDPFYLKSPLHLSGLMFILSLGLMLQRATEYRVRLCMHNNDMRMPAFEGSPSPDSRPTFFKLDRYLRSGSINPSVEMLLDSRMMVFNGMTPFFKELLLHMGEDWYKYYTAEAYMPFEYQGEIRL